ncbi:hypothetical protein MIDIC_140081 [Alphaproteobacteria bacterium]
MNHFFPHPAQLMSFTSKGAEFMASMQQRYMQYLQQAAGVFAEFTQKQTQNCFDAVKKASAANCAADHMQKEYLSFAKEGWHGYCELMDSLFKNTSNLMHECSDMYSNVCCDAASEAKKSAQSTSTCSGAATGTPQKKAGCN